MVIANFRKNMSEKPELEVIEETDVRTSKEHQIILYNDDINTFDHVISCLINICDQTQEQAEQFAYIVHYHGKCVVKTGTFEDLKPRCLKLIDAGLSAELV